MNNAVHPPTQARQFRIPKPFLLDITNPNSERITSTSAPITPNQTPVQTPLPSPLGDESVRGYAFDHRPKYGGAKQIVGIIECIENQGISCCVTAEPALRYYGARRIMFDWIITVPTDMLETVTTLFHDQPDAYERFGPNSMKGFSSLNHLYPRFKLNGMAVFFVLLPSQASHMLVDVNNIEYDRWIHIPYPKLSSYAQSLLDTWSLTDLEDLIDGMNLTIEWGEQNLILDGSVDELWAQWRATALAGRALGDDELPRWSQTRRVIWHRAASTQAKRSRQGWKAREDRETRFWKTGQQDPRDRPRNYD